MEDLKIKVNSELESEEAQDLFFELGYFWNGSGKDYFQVTSGKILAYSGGVLFQCGDESGTEINLEALRDLVHAKKNSDNDKEMNILDEGCFVMKKEEKHSHYKKDVSGLDFVDVYRVLKLFEVADPCLQHAVKKLLCSGQRGVKSVDKDVQEAIDSLLRYQEMKKEDLK